MGDPMDAPRPAPVGKKDAARLDPLDAMRGLAALTVVTYHFRHFGGDTHAYPLAQTMVGGFVFEHGWAFVDFFFVLSGVVMTYRYLEPIADHKIDGREFFVLRMSRLYPLHIVTLLVCAGIEWTCLALHKPEIIYNHNNLYDFFLHVFYLNSGGFEEAFSYNNPSWSVAVEVVAYMLFFLYASRARSGYVAASLCTIAVGIAIMRMGWMYPLLNGYVARGAIGFFVGSMLFLGVRALKRLGYGRTFARVAFAVAIAVFAITYAVGFDEYVGGTTLPLLLVIFPLVILVGLEIRPLAAVLSLRPLTFLGDVSYSVYLVHVPLQMSMLYYLREHHVEAPVKSGAFLAEFLGAVLILAYVVHRFFELPARRWVRARFGRPAKVERRAALVIEAHPS
jgi:peptidoglycan/LPS O-acetylase OafA/YrhL